MSWCKRRSICYYCKQPVESGKATVMTKVYRPGKWSYYNHYHIRCWVHQGIDYLRSHPYEPKSTPVQARGRPRLSLSASQKEQRLRLLKHRAVITLRKRAIIEKIAGLNEDNSHTADGMYKKLDKLDLKLEIIEQEIVLYGGVPRSWR